MCGYLPVAYLSIPIKPQSYTLAISFNNILLYTGLLAVNYSERIVIFFK